MYRPLRSSNIVWVETKSLSTTPSPIQHDSTNSNIRWPLATSSRVEGSGKDMQIPKHDLRGSRKLTVCRAATLCLACTSRARTHEVCGRRLGSNLPAFCVFRTRGQRVPRASGPPRPPSMLLLVFEVSKMLQVYGRSCSHPWLESCCGSAVSDACPTVPYGALKSNSTKAEAFDSVGIRGRRHWAVALVYAWKTMSNKNWIHPNTPNGFTSTKVVWGGFSHGLIWWIPPLHPLRRRSVPASEPQHCPGASQNVRWSTSNLCPTARKQWKQIEWQGQISITGWHTWRENLKLKETNKNSFESVPSMENQSFIHGAP